MYSIPNFLCTNLRQKIIFSLPSRIRRSAFGFFTVCHRLWGEISLYMKFSRHLSMRTGVICQQDNTGERIPVIVTIREG